MSIVRGPRGSEPPHHEGLRAEQLFLVLSIIKQASRTLEPTIFFRLLVDTIYREIKTFSHVSVFEWEPARGMARPVAMAGDMDGEGAAWGWAAPGGAIAEVIGSGATFVSNNLLSQARSIRPIARLSRSALCLPMKAGEKILALLNIESRETRAFAPPEVALFEILSEHLANILQGVTLYQQVRGQSVKINHITEICRQVFGAASLQEALNVAVRSVVEQYGCYCACVTFVSDDGRWLIHQAHHAQADVRIPEGYRQPIGQGIVGRVARERRTVCCNDTNQEPDYVPVVPGVRSELCIPLLAGGTLVGMLDLNALERGAFDAEDISLMETLARQLALVVDKSRFLEETRRARDYLENLIANAGDGILALDDEGRIIRWNAGMERLLGFKAEEILGRPFRDLPAPDSLQRADEILARALKGETLESIEDRARCKGGRIIDVVLTISPIHSASGAQQGISVIMRDVTERRAMDESFRGMHRQIVESEQKFLDLVEKSQDAIFFISIEDGAVVQANARAEEWTGLPREALVGRSFLLLHTEEERDRARARFEGTVRAGSGGSLELHLARSGAAAVDVEVTPGLLAYGGRNVVQWVCRDISDRRRAEKEKEALQLQLLQTEKLSAIGQLISGVAHELNNPLTGVIGYSQLLSGQECDEKIKRGLERVYGEAKRCHRIVQNLLTFARKHPPEKTYININDMVESTVELRSYQLRTDNIAMETSFAKDLPRTMGDFHQLQQVVMNIINNAHQAMKECGGGSLRIRTALEGERIRIELADTGPGIPAGNLKKIFDPFFTTKPTGQGTGLGLSICYGIIEEHDGKITASSEVGVGTTFAIELPVLKPAAMATSAAPARTDAGDAAPPAAAPPARLLIVDDEPSIVEVLSAALRERGHEVDTAINGRLALKKLMDESYDLVLTDLKMPGMDGQHLFDEVRRLRPALAEKFVFSTGDLIAGDTRDFLERSGKPWVEKPFDLQKVVALLSGAAIRTGTDAA